MVGDKCLLCTQLYLWQDLEQGVENPDIPAHVDAKGHDPGISLQAFGTLHFITLAQNF